MTMIFGYVDTSRILGLWQKDDTQLKLLTCQNNQDSQIY